MNRVLASKSVSSRAPARSISRSVQCSASAGSDANIIPAIDRRAFLAAVVAAASSSGVVLPSHAEVRVSSSSYRPGAQLTMTVDRMTCILFGCVQFALPSMHFWYRLPSISLLRSLPLSLPLSPLFPPRFKTTTPITLQDQHYRTWSSKPTTGLPLPPPLTVSQSPLNEANSFRALSCTFVRITQTMLHPPHYACIPRFQSKFVLYKVSSLRNASPGGIRRAPAPRRAAPSRPLTLKPLLRRHPLPLPPGGYGGNADEKPKYKFEYPALWKESAINKTDKGTKGIDCRISASKSKSEQASLSASVLH